jgi:hypothetical protein
MSGSCSSVIYYNLQGMSKTTNVIDIHSGSITEVKSKNHIPGNLEVSEPGISIQIARLNKR